MRASQRRASWVRVFRAPVVAAGALVCAMAGTAAGLAWTGGQPHQVLASAGLAGGRCHRVSPGSATSVCVRVLRGQTSVAARRAWLRDHPRVAAAHHTEGPASLPAPPAQCAFGSGQAVVNPDRFTSCTDTIWEKWTTTVVNGITEITGSLNLEDLQWNSYDGNANNPPTWTHGLIINVYQGAGTLASGTTANISSACAGTSNTCGVSSTLGGNGQNVNLAPGSTYKNAWIEKDTGPASITSGQIDVQSPLGIAIAGLGGPGVLPWNFTDTNLIGRCDTVANASDSCVNQAFIPTMNLSVATYGAAAAIVQWAQTNQSAHWGLEGQGRPLTRLYNSTQTQQNRKIICQTDWTPDQSITNALQPYGDQDSCDEFPFAATYQSGAMHGVTTGAQCAQVTAIQTGTSGKNEAADWAKVSPTSPNPSALCVRGHIPLNLNRNAGSAYASFISSVRLVDSDPFWLAVTP